MPSEPWVLGVSASHNGGACLLHGDRIVAAIQEERLLRAKRAWHSAAQPSLSVGYCLAAGRIGADQLDAIAVCAVGSSRAAVEEIHTNPQLAPRRSAAEVIAVPHHLGHAAAAYALSGHARTGILVVDGGGAYVDDLGEDERRTIRPGQIDRFVRRERTAPLEHISLYSADHGVITPLEKHIKSYLHDTSEAPEAEFQSLGDMYAFVGQQIFGSIHEGPGKVMGLAPYGVPELPVEAFLEITEGGLLFQRLSGRAETAAFLSETRKLDATDRWPAHRQAYQNLAAGVQRALEEALLDLARWLRARGKERMAYAGGVALNSVANERIVREAGFSDVFIMPAAEDSGTAIGAAYQALWQLHGYKKIERQTRDRLGRVYGAEEIEGAIASTPGVRVVAGEDLIDRTASLLAEGKILGWFQEGSELGPRALGQRSILCDPRKAVMKDVLNARVKFREGFRPFAPIVLAEDVGEWFEVDPAHADSPFMLRVLPFKKERAAKVGAVVHVDGTGRVQTVAKESFPVLHRLVSRFKEMTGIPILLNTSFNIAGEPIVETPADALWCLLFTDLDGCVLGDRIVEKEAGSDPVLDRPLALSADAVSLRADLSGVLDLALPDVAEAGEQVFSVPASRAAELEAHAARNPWLRLTVRVTTRWGEALHGLPGGHARILALIDDRRTGREIFARLSAERSTATPYSLAQLRRQLGLLRRVSAIRLCG
jgi:carbamoyltransferase